MLKMTCQALLGLIPATLMGDFSFLYICSYPSPGPLPEFYLRIGISTGHPLQLLDKAV